MPNKLKQVVLKIDSILGGHSPLWAMSGENQFLDSIGIDPESEFSSKVKALGGINPTGVKNLFSGSSLPDAPVWVMGTNTTTGYFVYCAGGSLYTYSMADAVDEDGGLLKMATSAGDGAVIYDDYLYLANKTNIGRVGQLSATGPTYVDFWSNSLYLGQSALTDNSSNFPNDASFTYPQHVMHLHNDGWIYIADYASGLGYIHSFYVSSAGATQAIYGDLTLPPGLYPMDIKSYGTDLAILCSPVAKYASGAIPIPGKSALILWDAVSQNFYRNVPISEALATAMISKNGELYVLSGNTGKGSKLSRYLGGYSFSDLTQFEEGSPPPASAADSLGDMLVWGVSGTVPTTYAGVMSYNYRRGALRGRGARNNLMRVTDKTNTYPFVTSLKFIKRSGYPMVGWRTSATYGLDAVGSPATYASNFRSRIFDLRKPFVIRRITIPLSLPVASGMAIYPKVYIDGENKSYELPAIDSTNFPGSENIIDFTNLAITGNHDFYIQFTWGGTTEVGILPGVNIEVDIYE